MPQAWAMVLMPCDDAIARIDSASKEGKPFFTYLAFNAPHSPLHAPRENVEKYYERYLPGWESLRKQRYDRMRSMGLIDERYVMTEPEAEVRRWDELSEATQRQESRRMSAYAGMLDRLDWNVGRLLAHLQAKGLEDDEVLVGEECLLLHRLERRAQSIGQEGILGHPAGQDGALGSLALLKVHVDQPPSGLEGLGQASQKGRAVGKEMVGVHHQNDITGRPGQEGVVGKPENRGDIR